MGQKCESSRNLKQNANSNNNLILEQCKSTRDKIELYIKNLEKKEMNSREKAKELLKTKQRDRAKFYLKGCKLYQQKIKIAEGKLSMMDDQIMSIENAQTAQETLKALQEGNKALNDLQKEVKVEDLENLKENLEEQKENDKEIGEYLKGVTNDYEAECEEELEQLTKEVHNEHVVNNNQNISLPNVPKNNITVEQKNNINSNINNKQIVMNQKI